MSKGAEQPQLEDFSEIIKRNEPLAPYTHLKIGGPAEMLIQPRSVKQLRAVIGECLKNRIFLRVLGSGCSILVRDEGVRGAVLRLNAPVFSEIIVDGQRVRTGGGAALSALIS